MANLPEVGLNAVIQNVSGFEASAKVIINALDTIEKGAGNVEKTTGNMGSAFSSLTSGLSGLGGQFVGLGQGVLKFGAIAGGVALAGTVALTAGVVALGASALGEVAKFERMNLSIQNLVAREISGGKVIEQATQTRIQLTKKESEELDKLKGSQDNEANSRDVLTARIQEQKERIRQLTEQYGSNGLVVIKERAELQGMELDLNDLNKNIDEHKARIVELESKNGQLISTLQKVRVGQVSMSEAMKEAAPRAKELIKWIQMLAIQSPFTSEGIQNAFQTALAYGFTSEQAQRLTEAEIDFISATGKSAESADLIALALGQVQARGKLSAQELRQLSEQGVGVNKILEDMGFTLDDVSNGLVPVDKFIEAVIKDMEVFKGSAKAQATTFSGLISSLEEIKSVGLREFFTGTFQAIQPYLASFVDFLTNAALQTGGIRALGDVLGNYVATALKDIVTAIAVFQAGGLAVFSKYLGVEGIPLWYELQKLLTNITTTITNLSGAMEGPLSSALSNIAQNIIPTITQAIQFINQHFEEFKGALLGVGAVLAAGVFVALVAAVLSLLTPLNLIIAGAALLGAAWAGNWGGIQEKTAAVWAFLQPILTQIWTWLQVNIPVAIQFLSTTWTTVLVPAFTVVSTFVTGTLIPVLSQLWTWLSTNIPPVIVALSDLWLNTLLPAVTAFWDFFNTSLMPLWVSFITLINAVVMKAIQALAGLWSNILYPAILKVGDFISQNLQPILLGLVGVFADKLTPNTKEFTEGILPKLEKALNAVGDVIKDVTGFFNSLASAVSNFSLPEVLQQHSPSPFEQSLIDIGIAAQGATVAIEDMSNATQSGFSGASLDQLLGVKRGIASTGNVVGSAADDVEKLLDKRLSGSKGKFALTALKDVFKANSEKILGAADPKAMFLQLARQNVNFEKAGISGTQANAIPEAISLFIKQFYVRKKELEKAQQEIFIQAGRTALTIGNQLNDIVKSSADILNQRVETLQQLVGSGAESVNFEGQIISQTQAQEKLNQALEEQKRIQSQILIEQQNEMKLNFLQKQLDLVETISQAGLNVDDILGGLTLGLNASIPDMIEATNRLVTAMINQVDQDLQIHSPSKVMAEKGRMTGQGFVQGILGQIPNIAGAMAAAINGPSMAGPAYVGAGGGGTVNNFYTGGNNINNGMDEATFESRVIGVIRRQLR